jgi:hypothetical protein
MTKITSGRPAQGGASAKMRRGHAVDARHHLHAFLHHGEIRRVCAEIAKVRTAHGEEAAVFVERKLGLDGEIARLIVAEERFVPLDDPFHRPAELARRPGHERKFRVDHAAGAEIAADVPHQHADLVRRHAENGGKIGLQPHRAAIAGIDRKASRRRIERRQRGARLHRNACHALNPGLEPRHMRGAGEGRLGRRGVAKFRIEADIRPRALVHARRVLPRGGHGLDHRGQGFVVDRDQLGAVLGGVKRFGDDHRHRFADKARLVGGQRMMRRLEWRNSAAVAKLRLRGMRRPRFMRNGLQPVRHAIRSSQDRQHAGGRRGLVLFDAADAGMCVRGAHHHRIDLAGKVLVGGVAAAAPDKPHVFAAAHRLTDAGTVGGLMHCVLRRRC